MQHKLWPRCPHIGVEASFYLCDLPRELEQATTVDQCRRYVGLALGNFLQTVIATIEVDNQWAEGYAPAGGVLTLAKELQAVGRAAYDRIARQKPSPLPEIRELKRQLARAQLMIQRVEVDAVRNGGAL